MAYTASCSALALLEYLAQVSTLPSGLMLMPIVPENLKIERVHSIPADPKAFAQIGDEWLDSKSTAILQVPSVLAPRQKNYLINPEHSLFGTISVIEMNPFAFDSRLLSSIPVNPAT
jgi:RES domain-containing protein